MSPVDKYLNRLSEPQRRELERIRRIIKELVPGAEEVMSYGMPGFKYKKKYLAGYAVFKDHLSLFPTAEPVVVIKAKLAAYKTSKGTIQFTLDNPLPETLISELVKIRLHAINQV